MATAYCHVIATLAGPASAGPAAGTTELRCSLCGCWFEPRDGEVFCEDCELSDCTYCGVTTNRPLLSDDLACSLCAGEPI